MKTLAGQSWWRRDVTAKVSATTKSNRRRWQRRNICRIRRFFENIRSSELRGMLDSLVKPSRTWVFSIDINKSAQDCPWRLLQRKRKRENIVTMTRKGGRINIYNWMCCRQLSCAIEFLTFSGFQNTFRIKNPLTRNSATRLTPMWFFRKMEYLERCNCKKKLINGRIRPRGPQRPRRTTSWRWRPRSSPRQRMTTSSCSSNTVRWGTLTRTAFVFALFL